MVSLNRRARADWVIALTLPGYEDDFILNKTSNLSQGTLHSASAAKNHKSVGFNPVFLAMRASIAGPNSSPSAKDQV